MGSEIWTFPPHWHGGPKTPLNCRTTEESITAANLCGNGNLVSLAFDNL